MIDPFAKPTMTAAQAAKLLGVSRNGMYDAIKRGDIPTIKVGKRIFVISAKLREMIDAKSAPEPEQYDVDRIADIVAARILKKLAEALR